ncbi:MAG: VOC family protein [Longimicrobiaceae bacterium]
MSILAIHHIGLVCSDAQRTLDYYTRVLGLRLVKKTVDAEDPSSYRLYFGDQTGTPGCLLSVVERRGAEPGHEGVGGSHHFALLVETRDALLQWKRWLTDLGVTVSGPLDRHYFESIYHRDPDGQVIEIATRGAGWTRDEAPERIGMEHRPPPPEMLKGNLERERIKAESWPEPVSAITEEMRFRQMHHVTAIGDDIERTHAFVAGGPGLRRVKRTSNFDMPDSYHWYWGVGEGEPGTVVTYFERKGAAAVRRGPGQIDHYALSVADDDALEATRERLVAADFPAAEIEDGVYLRSFRTEDPHGQPVEIATLGPGFEVDEPPDALGTQLVLPPSLEGERARIEGALRPLTMNHEEGA